MAEGSLRTTGEVVDSRGAGSDGGGDDAILASEELAQGIVGLTHAVGSDLHDFTVVGEKTVDLLAYVVELLVDGSVTSSVGNLIRIVLL